MAKIFHFLRFFRLPRAQKLLLPLSRLLIPLVLLHSGPWKTIFYAESPPESKYIVLSKKDYFQRIVGNAHEFFFFVVFTEESLSEAQQIASVLASSSQKYLDSSLQVSVYLIERSVYRDIRQTINRVKNHEVYEKDNRNNSIEIYFKTTYSGNQAYLKYKPGSFLTDRSQKKTFKLIRKLTKPVEQISDAEELFRRFQLQIFSRGDAPLVLRTTPDGANEKNLKKFKKTAFSLFERKLLPLNASFITVSNPSLLNLLGLQNNETYILRNDLISKLNLVDSDDVSNSGMNESGGQHMNPLKNLTTKPKNIEAALKEMKGCLEEYSSFKKKLINLEKNAFQEIKSEKIKEFNCFASFVSPRVFHLTDTKTRSLAPFFKKVNLNRKKPVLSFIMSPEDRENKTRIMTLQRVFEKYKEQCYFAVMESGQMEEFFPHANALYPRFCLFNFFNQNKADQLYKNYYKSLLYPYEKKFLIDKEEYFESFEALKERIDSILGKGKQLEIDYLSKSNELVDEINGDLLNKMLQGKEAMVLEIYDSSCESNFARQVFNKIRESHLKDSMNEEAQPNSLEYNKTSKDSKQPEPPKSIKFLRMKHLDDSPHLINLDRFPAYLYFHPETRSIHIYQPDFMAIGFRHKLLEETLRSFIYGGQVGNK